MTPKAASFSERVRLTIDRYSMFTPADRILVGLSGGADSVALFRALHELGYPIATAHVNHGLRGEDASRDEDFVRDLASLFQIPIWVHRIAPGSLEGNIEAAARNERHRFLEQMARERGCPRIALAHNLHDRIETFWMHLVRGAGTDGLLSMQPVRGSVVRPLIELDRVAIEDYLRGIGQAWREDLTNRDTSRTRNRIRHELVPALKDRFNPRIDEAVLRTLSILEADHQALDEVCRHWIEIHGTYRHPDFVIPVQELAGLPIAMQRRAVRSALRKVQPDLMDLSYERVEAILGLVSSQSGRLVEVPGGSRVERCFERLHFSKTPAQVAAYEYALPIPGEVHIPEAGRRIRATLVSSASGTSGNAVFADGERLGAYVRIRGWKHGDFYSPVGQPAGKVRSLFQKAGIPRSQRSRWPVVVAGSSIVWVATFPVSREFAPGIDSGRLVAFEAAPL